MCEQCWIEQREKMENDPEIAAMIEDVRLLLDGDFSSVEARGIWSAEEMTQIPQVRFMMAAARLGMILGKLQDQSGAVALGQVAGIMLEGEVVTSQISDLMDSLFSRQSEN